MPRKKTKATPEDETNRSKIFKKNLKSYENAVDLTAKTSEQVSKCSESIKDIGNKFDRALTDNDQLAVSGKLEDIRGCLEQALDLFESLDAYLEELEDRMLD